MRIFLFQAKNDIGGVVVEDVQSATVAPESVLAYYGINTRSNRFSKEQLSELTSAFEENPYPTSTKKQELSDKTGLTIGQIENWLWKKKRENEKEGKIG
jgi:hypothetical protein